MMGLPIVLFLTFLALGAQGCETDRRQCYQASTTLAPPSTSERDAVLLARCHKFCLERILSADSSTTPSTNTSSLPCQLFQKIMECRSGCMKMAKNPTLSRNQCRNECHASCLRDCNNTNRCIFVSERSSCIRKCQRTSCRQGCSVYNSILNTIQDEEPPASPITPPLLTKTELELRKYDAGVFDVSYNSSELTNSSGFLFTVQDNSRAYFVIQDDISKPLDLGFFACSEVNVSFAVVNAYGTSNYSAPTQVCVHGETRFPSQVNETTIRFPSILEDTRPGFLGNAVVDITWEKPSGFEYLTHYVLTIYSRSAVCGGESITYNYIINRELTSYIVQAHHPNAAPSFGSGDVFESCRYIVFLQSQPARFTQDRARTFLAVYHTSQAPAPLKLSCHKSINKTTGNIAFTTTWEIKSESSSLEQATLEAIRNYNVLLLKQDDPQTLGRPILSQALITGCNENFFESRTEVGYFIAVAYCDRNGSGDYQVHELRPFNNSNVQYRIRLSPQQNRRFFWRRIPGRQGCSINALPEPPAAVNRSNILISDFTLNSTMLFLNISWTPPSETYGEIQQYQVQVGAEPVTEEQNPTTHTAFSDGNTSLVISTNEFYVPDELCCIYIQIRSQNEFIWSNWSEPIILQRRSATVTHPPTGESQHTSTVYSVVSVVVFMASLVVFVVVTASTCKKYLYKKYFHKKPKQENNIYQAN